MPHSPTHSRVRWQLGLPWEDVPATLRYGSLLLANDDERELHVRLNLPSTADSARALEHTIFEARRWPEPGSAVAAEHPLYGESPLHPVLLRRG